MQGASPSGFELRSDVKPFAMSWSQIDEMAHCFADAAGRAVSARFEGVEIHGAHFYLISSQTGALINMGAMPGDARPLRSRL